MKQTALHSVHAQQNAKMADFQGWQLPLHFTNATEEYFAVRAAAGLFDVGQVGRIEVRGTGARELLQNVFTRNVEKIGEGVSAYGLLCDDKGYIIDDCLLFHLPSREGADRFLLTTNPIYTDKVMSWLTGRAGGEVAITDRSAELAHLALQGPRSDEVLDLLAGAHPRKIKHYHVRDIELAGINVMVSRTGYTGERGYEFIFPAEAAETLWHAILKAGKDAAILPCGMACRDMLRIEMGYVLAGFDIDETRTPIEAGLARFIDWKKDFIGKEALLKRKQEEPKARLTGFELFAKGIPKPGGIIFSGNREIGVVTSGSHSPHRRKDVGLGYVATRYSQEGLEIEVELKDREIAAMIVQLPFYRKK